jgi:hypothetical protein
MHAEHNSQINISRHSTGLAPGHPLLYAICFWPSPYSSGSPDSPLAALWSDPRPLPLVHHVHHVTHAGSATRTQKVVFEV